MISMMAFFLVMWLLAIASPQELKRLAEYFRTPLEVALTKGERSSSDFSPIPGGGEDPTRQEGNVHKGLAPSEAGQDTVKLKRLRDVLEQLIANDPRLQKLRPQLLIDLVEEGLRIQIIDNQNRPMFSTGSVEVATYMSVILRTISPLLNDIPYKISISGHTDATPYDNAGHGYSNWELSADRANASRRELVLAENKVLGVVWMASTINLDNQYPDAAINRRISLLVLNKRTERSLAHENGQSQEVIFDGTEVRQRPELLRDIPAAATTK